MAMITATAAGLLQAELGRSGSRISDAVKQLLDAQAGAS